MQTKVILGQTNAEQQRLYDLKFCNSTAVIPAAPLSSPRVFRSSFTLGYAAAIYCKISSVCARHHMIYARVSELFRDPSRWGAQQQQQQEHPKYFTHLFKMLVRTMVRAAKSWGFAGGVASYPMPAAPAHLRVWIKRMRSTRLAKGSAADPRVPRFLSVTQKGSELLCRR